MAMKEVLKVLAAQIGICVLLMVFGINYLFADIKVPNEFSSGTPATASEVNENFAALVEDIQGFTEPENMDKERKDGRPRYCFSTLL